MREQAEKAQVQGWAKNLPDGRVETMLCGDEKNVMQVEAALHQGPRLAKVDAVEGESCNPTKFQGFSIS